MANVTQNRISNTFTASELTTLSTQKTAYAAVVNAKTVALTEDELKQLGGVNVDNQVFIDDVIRQADAEGLALLPPPIAALVPELVKDNNFYKQLDAEKDWHNQQITRIEHTQRLLGHEGYNVSRTIYNNYALLAEAGVPGAQARYDVLKPRFAKSSDGRPQAAPPPANPS